MSSPVGGNDVMPTAAFRFFIMASVFGGPAAFADDTNPYLDLDFHTLLAAREAVQLALETRQTGETQTWSVPGVARGSVMPRRTWRSESGHWCREFEETVRLEEGLTGTAMGTRCRNDNGRWLQAKP